MKLYLKVVSLVAGAAVFGAMLLLPKTSRAGATTGDGTAMNCSADNLNYAGTCTGSFLAARNSSDSTDYVQFASYALMNSPYAGEFRASIKGHVYTCTFPQGTNMSDVLNARGSFTVKWLNYSCSSVALINGSQYADY